MKRSLLAVVALALGTAAAGAQEAAQQKPAMKVGVGQTEHHIFVRPADIEWKPGPAVLPAGAQMTVLEGDPSRPGLFTMRLKLPDGFRIAPHFHGADEHVTVISGTFVLGLSDTWNEDNVTEFSAGGFAVMPAGMRHFAFTRGETVVQVHAVGPWQLTYVNPADDPRRPATR